MYSPTTLDIPQPARVPEPPSAFTDPRAGRSQGCCLVIPSVYDTRSAQCILLPS
ncbi:hypothetical protein BD779DRAFT_1557949, partial [Infundibulicybe gibba]